MCPHRQLVPHERHIPDVLVRIRPAALDDEVGLHPLEDLAIVESLANQPQHPRHRGRRLVGKEPHREAATAARRRHRDAEPDRPAEKQLG
jgi:hypothetical protein